MVDYIVGTNAPIADAAAVRFTAHFYQALAVGSTTREAFHTAKGKLVVGGDKERAEQYELLIRAGADETKPLLPPFVGSITRVATTEDITSRGDINIGNVGNEGLKGFPPTAAPQQNTRREVDVKVRGINGDGDVNIFNERNRYE